MSILNSMVDPACLANDLQIEEGDEFIQVNVIQSSTANASELQLNKMSVSELLEQLAPFTVTTDASGIATGGAISQEFENGHQPIAFMSKKLNPAATNYPTHEAELLAVIQALKEWRCYLQDRKRECSC